MESSLYSTNSNQFQFIEWKELQVSVACLAEKLNCQLSSQFVCNAGYEQVGFNCFSIFIFSTPFITNLPWEKSRKNVMVKENFDFNIGTWGQMSYRPDRSTNWGTRWGRYTYQMLKIINLVSKLKFAYFGNIVIFSLFIWHQYIYSLFDSVEICFCNMTTHWKQIPLINKNL